MAIDQHQNEIHKTLSVKSHQQSNNNEDKTPQNLKNKQNGFINGDMTRCHHNCFDSKKKFLKCFNKIHTHCLTCIKPKKCIRIPVAFQRAEQFSMEEKYAIILDVNYYVEDDCGVYSSFETNHNDDKNTKYNEENDLKDCPVVRCTNNGCQMIMHYCKLSEHLLLCQFQTVSCINSFYGCPHTLQRGKMSLHLLHCPANVVHCSAEWNRWPLYSTEKNSQAQVFCSPHSLNINNLDVALALRDQRMLKQLSSASRQLKRIMRGCLANNPAVPIKPYIGIRTFREYRHIQFQTSDETQAYSLKCTMNIDEEKYLNYAAKLVEEAYQMSLLELLKKTVVYYRKRYYERATEYCNQSRKKSNSICHVSNTSTNLCSANAFASSLSYSPFPSSSSINLPILTNPDRFFLSEINNKTNPDQTAIEEMSIPPPPRPPPVPKCNMLSLEIAIRSYAFYQPKPRSMYTFRCGLDFRKDELASHSRDIHSDIHAGLDNWIEHRCPLFQYGCTFVHRRWFPMSASNQLQTIVYNESLETFGCCSKSEHNEIDDNLNFYRQSPSLFSIDSELNDLECPVINEDKKKPLVIHCMTDSKTMSSYNDNSGFSSAMTHTTFPSSSSSYSFLSNSSIPLIPTTPTNATTPSVLSSRKSSLQTYSNFFICTISSLPFEVLQNICKFLDGFSLNNLSFTSKSMRIVVQTFVKKKGYVLLQWKRFETEKGKYQWRIAYKKWMFSTAIEPIKGWSMDCNNLMAQHLQVCPFNERSVPSQPFIYAQDCKSITTEMSTTTEKLAQIDKRNNQQQRSSSSPEPMPSFYRK